jgi:hypothetical protein
MNKKQINKEFTKEVNKIFGECNHHFVKNENGRKFCLNCLRYEDGTSLISEREDESSADIRILKKENH